MSVSLYMDVHVRRAVTIGLRRRGINVLTAQEDNAAQLSDDKLLDRSTDLRRVLFSQDDDLLAEGTRRQREGSEFGGVIYCHQLRLSVGAIIENLEIIANCLETEDFANRVEFLPL